MPKEKKGQRAQDTTLGDSIESERSNIVGSIRCEHLQKGKWEDFEHILKGMDPTHASTCRALRDLACVIGIEGHEGHCHGALLVMCPGELPKGKIGSYVKGALLKHIDGTFLDVQGDERSIRNLCLADGANIFDSASNLVAQWMSLRPPALASDSEVVGGSRHTSARDFTSPDCCPGSFAFCVSESGGKVSIFFDGKLIVKTESLYCGRKQQEIRAQEHCPALNIDWTCNPSALCKDLDLIEGNIFPGPYKRIQNEKMPNGQFGPVWRAHHHNQQGCAVKQVNLHNVSTRTRYGMEPTEDMRHWRFDNISQEIVALTKISHIPPFDMGRKHIVDLLEIIVDINGLWVCIVQRWAGKSWLEHLNLWSRISHKDFLRTDIEEEECRSIIKHRYQLCHQLFLAVHFLHNTVKLYHLDISLENMLIYCKGACRNRPHLKLADFGVSQWSVGSAEISSDVMVGKFYAMAPEIYNQKGSFDGSACDAWSVGISVFEVVVGDQLLKRPENTDPGFRAMENGDWTTIFQTFARGKGPWRDAEVDILKGLLHVIPAARMTMKMALARASMWNDQSLVDDGFSYTCLQRQPESEFIPFELQRAPCPTRKSPCGCLEPSMDERICTSSSSSKADQHKGEFGMESGASLNDILSEIRGLHDKIDWLSADRVYQMPETTLQQPQMGCLDIPVQKNVDVDVDFDDFEETLPPAAVDFVDFDDFSDVDRYRYEFQERKRESSGSLQPEVVGML